MNWFEAHFMAGALFFTAISFLLALGLCRMAKADPLPSAPEGEGAGLWRDEAAHGIRGEFDAVPGCVTVETLDADTASESEAA